MKWILELKGGYQGFFSAPNEAAAERKAKRIVLARYYGGIRPATQADIHSIQAMGGKEIRE